MSDKIYLQKRELVLAVSGASTLTTPLTTKAHDGICRIVTTAGIFLQLITSGTQTCINSNNYYVPANLPEKIRYQDGQLVTALNVSAVAVLHVTELQ
jgi:hypothetical protein